jgi:ABC-type nitrate/sulfonate/bicarbonate transport system substrate-binding protein
VSLQAFVSRRELLSLAALAAASGLLSACAAAAAPSAGSPAASTASKPATSVSAAAAASPSQSADLSLKVAYPVVTGAQTPLWLADSLGLFTQQHLKVSTQLIQANVAAKSLVAKEIDVLLQSASPIITADLNGSAGLVYVASAYNHAQSSLMVPASIKAAGELKGKIWGTDQPGTATDYYSQLLMQLVGLKKTDVEYRVLGANDITLADLLAGQIQAGAISPPATFKAEASGFHSLKDTYDVPYQNVGVVVLQDRLPELTPALQRFLVAYRQGMQAYTQQPDAAKKLLQQYGKIEDQATLDKSYTFYVNQTHFQLDLQPTMVGIQQMLDFLSDSIPAAKNAKPEQFVDTRLLGQLPKV